jgi:predicted membrane-bound spermidine synthase
MTPNEILLAVWAALAVCFLALLIYRGQLTRYEDEQLFLNDEVHTEEQKTQQDIVRRVNKLTPLVNLFGGAAGLLTASIIGVYVWNAWQQIR